jgi:hypothetical protein
MSKPPTSQEAVMHPYLTAEYLRVRHADLLRDAESYRAATAHRPRPARRRPLGRRRGA